MGRGRETGVVLVTGAASGMGRDAAVYLNELGYTVFAGVRKPGDTAPLKEEAAHPDCLHELILDVTNADHMAPARARVEAVAGERGLIGLFSNAGIAAYFGDTSCEGCPIETQQRVMEVNHFGAVRVIQTFLPLIRQAKGTVVVNSALMAKAVIPFSAGYASSKMALEAWADSLRREVRPHGVRVVMVEAGAIATSLDAKQHPERIPSGPPYPEMRPMAEYFMSSMSKVGGKRSASPRRMSEIVADAIGGRKKRPRYIVGTGAGPIRFFGRLPDRWQDAGIEYALRRFRKS
jgi:NAD(P)-dependent dehydrogenase (short-subunit alcohol dehydrogenase family)